MNGIRMSIVKDALIVSITFSYVDGCGCLSVYWQAIVKCLDIERDQF